MHTNQEYDVDVYLSTDFDFFAKDDATELANPIWSLRNLTYTLAPIEHNSQNTTIQLDLNAL